MERRFIALFFLLGVFSFFAVTFVRNHSARPSLRKAFIVIRHDKHKENEEWRPGPGNLSMKEKVEGYRLGRKLSVRYRNFLGYQYRPEEFTAYSISNEHTMAAARLLSSGLFPPPGSLWWRNEERWHTVPVFSETLFNRSICPRLYDEMIASIRELNLPEMKNYSNREDFVQDNGVESVDFDHVPAMFLKFFRSQSNNSGFQRHVIGGPYVDKLINFFTKSTKKMELHVWNNMNILIFLDILRIEISSAGEAAFAIAIEAHEINKENYFEVYYISNSQTFKPKPVIMPCGESCPLAELISLSKDYNQEENKDFCNGRTV